MLRSIAIDDANQAARQAADEIESWLRSLDDTLQVINVEGEIEYQRKDIDLVWSTKRRTYLIELKGDRWHRSGNFFFETQSNKEKDTPGCFLYTEADYLFYYFLIPKNMYCLPMPATRVWFQNNMTRFKVRETTTPVGEGKHYTTVGRLVPIQTVLDEVPGVRQVKVRKAVPGV